MKTILLWDPRFPDRRPARLTVEDTVASAAVRAGVAAAANPAEAGALSAGGALDPGTLTEVALQHGLGSAIRRVFLPYSVALVGAAAGVLAAVGTPLAAGTALPTLTLTGPLSYATNAAAGTLVANIGNVPAGVTPTLTPNDGRLVVAGSAGAWTVVTGLSASTAGTFTLAVAAAGANGANAPVTVVAAAVTLAALTASNAAATVGSAFTSTISGATSGSTLSLTGAGAPGLSVSGNTISGTPTTAGAVNVVETLAGATNSPRTTSGLVSVAAGFQAPAMNQRVALTGTPQSSMSDSGLVTALTNMASQRTLPSWSTARVVKMPIEAVPNGARAYFTSGARDITARQSFDSTDGSNGTWATLTVKNCAKGGSGPAGLVVIPAGAARWIEITSGSDAGAFGLFHLATDGTLPDLFVQTGASHTDGGMKPLLMRARAQVQFSGRDPIFLNEGWSAQDITPVRANTQNALTLWPEAVGYIEDTLIGNNITPNRPYTSGQASGLLAAVSGLYGDITSAGKKIVGASNATFRNYGDPTSVNFGAVPENGSAPYNVNVMHPALSQIGFINPTTGAAYTDVYSLMLYYEQTLIDNTNDAVHPTAAGYQEMMDEYIRQDLSFYWTGARATPTSSRLVGLLETLANALGSTTYRQWVWTGYLVRDLPTSSYKTALQSRVDAVAPAARLVDATNAVVAFEAGKTAALKTVANSKLALVDVPPYASQKTALQNRIDAVVVNNNVVAIVHFGTNAAPAPANNTGTTTGAGSQGQKIANIKNLDGANTGWSLFVTDGSNSSAASGGAQTGNNSGAFADDVLLGGASNSTSTEVIEFEARGLDPTKTYNIDASGSSTTTASVVQVTLNGTTLTGAGGIFMPTYQQLNFTGQVSRTGVTPIDLGSGVIGIRGLVQGNGSNSRISGLRITQVNT